MWRLALRLLLLLPHSGGFLFFSLRRCVSYLELVLSWNIYIISVWLLYRGWISALKRNFPVHKLFCSLCVLFLLFFFPVVGPFGHTTMGKKPSREKQTVHFQSTRYHLCGENEARKFLCIQFIRPGRLYGTEKKELNGIWLYCTE